MVRLIPRDEKFFDLFTKTGEIIRQLHLAQFTLRP